MHKCSKFYQYIEVEERKQILYSFFCKCQLYLICLNYVNKEDLCVLLPLHIRALGDLLHLPLSVRILRSDVCLDVLHHPARVCWEVLLVLCHQSFQTLDPPPLALIVEHMRHMFAENPLPPRPGVDACIRHADGPGRVSDGHLHVLLVGQDVVLVHDVLHHA